MAESEQTAVVTEKKPNVIRTVIERVDRRSINGFMVLSGFLFVTDVLLFHETPEKVQNVLLVMLGALVVMAKDVINYDYSSSSGSDKKDDMVLKAAKTGAAILAALLIGVSLLMPTGAIAAPKKQDDARAQAARGLLRPGTSSQGSGETAELGAPGGDASKNQSLLAKIIAKPFNDLADFIASDATEAIALSTAVPALQDGHGQACWTEMKTFTEVIKAHPIPLTFKLMKDIEAIRLAAMAANRICGNASCQVVFTDLRNQFLAANPIRLGPLTDMMLPTLTDLCSKVPQISVMAPTLPIVPLPAPAPAKP